MVPITSLVYDENIFGSSSEVLENFWTFLENVWERSSGLRNNFGKSSDIFKSGQKSLENHQKPCHYYVYFMKRMLHVSSKI